MPVIDLRGDRDLVARQIDGACIEIGEHKMAVAIQPGEAYGYGPRLVERLAASLGADTPPDLKETFSTGPFKARGSSRSSTGTRRRDACCTTPTSMASGSSLDSRAPASTPTTARSHCCVRTPRSAGSRCSTCTTSGTNDRWRSTVHRVGVPPLDATESCERYSIAFFPNANWDARIECLPTCHADGESPRYPPVLAGRHLMDKFRSTQPAATAER